MLLLSLVRYLACRTIEPDSVLNCGSCASGICTASWTDTASNSPGQLQLLAAQCVDMRKFFRKQDTDTGFFQLPQRGERLRSDDIEPRQPAMDLSRDKNAEEMKWSPLEMGAAMQAHGA